MIQIRDVPEPLHRQIKARAAMADMSLSDDLLSEIGQVAERPTLDELRARLRSRTETAPSEPPADAVMRNWFVDSPSQSQFSSASRPA